MTTPAQSYSNHSRYVPAYHYLQSGLVLVLFIWSVVQLVKYPSVTTAMGVALTVTLLLITWYMRAFALTVQDRVIRLEETLRLERVLPADLKVRVPELTVSQLVALRFASDAELPDLCRRALDEKLGARAIKQQVKVWRADHLRA